MASSYRRPIGNCHGLGDPWSGGPNFCDAHDLLNPRVASTQGWKAMTHGAEFESRVFALEERG